MKRKESSVPSQVYSVQRGKKIIFLCQESSCKEPFEIKAGGDVSGCFTQPLQQCKQAVSIIQLINCLNSTLKKIQLFFFFVLFHSCYLKATLKSYFLSPKLFPCYSCSWRIPPWMGKGCFPSLLQKLLSWDVVSGVTPLSALTFSGTINEL